MLKPPAEDDVGSGTETAPTGAKRKLLYGLSLPERTLRSTAGVVGGTLRESATVLLPKAVRNAKTYQVFVGQMLDFMAENMGGVDRSLRPGGGGETPPVDGFVARKTVGNFIDVASLATFHLSPMLLLAIVSDAAYGSKAYLRELAEELRKQGVIEDSAQINRVDDLLDAVAAASDKAATAFDTPPLSVEGLRDTVRQTRAAVAEIDPTKVLPQRDMAELWSDIQAAAQREGVSAFKVSGLMTLGSLDKVGKLGGGALSTAQAAGTLFDRHVLNHYRGVLADIDQVGFYPSLAAASRPYLEAAWRNFSHDRTTLTEQFLSRGAGRAWNRAQRWLASRR